MNDRSWKEANEDAPQLKYVDVETFIQFAEYCYTKNYRAIVEVVSEGERSIKGDDDNSDDDNDEDENPSEEGIKACFAHCRCYRQNRIETDTYWTLGKHICYSCDLPKPELWREFMNRKFGSFYLTHDDLRTHLDNMRPQDKVAIKVIQHAKLCVFADQYLLQPLIDLCLHKLHRDLLEYDIEENGVQEIVDLLNYVYENTSSSEVAAGARWDLRDLVMTFAVCKAEMLVEDPAFGVLMESGTEVASDFARYIVKRLV